MHRWLQAGVMDVRTLPVRLGSPNRLAEVFNRLNLCSWYWGAMNNAEASQRLKNEAIGTFLLRDSTDSRYLFTLSVKTLKGMLNIRVIYERGRFSLDSMDSNKPHFDCVLKLINYFTGVSKNIDGRTVFAILTDKNETSTKEIGLVLQKPLFHKPPTLMHLCRRIINRTYSVEQVFELHLPEAIESYMIKYPYSI